MDHGQLVGVLAGEGIHRIEGEVIAVGVGIVDTGHGTVFIFRTPYKLVDQQTLLGSQFLHSPLRGQLQSTVPLVGGHDHGQEHAVLALDGDHAMGRGGFIEDGVALMKHVLVLTHPDTHGTLEHQVELLSVM